MNPENVEGIPLFVPKPKKKIPPNTVYFPTSTTGHKGRLSLRIRGKFVNVSALARTVGVDQAHVFRVLKGQRNPSVPLATKLAKALKISLGTLIDEIELSKIIN